MICSVFHSIFFFFINASTLPATPSNKKASTSVHHDWSRNTYRFVELDETFNTSNVVGENVAPGAGESDGADVATLGSFGNVFMAVGERVSGADEGKNVGDDDAGENVGKGVGSDDETGENVGRGVGRTQSPSSQLHCTRLHARSHTVLLRMNG